MSMETTSQAQEGGLEKLPYAAEAPFNAYIRQHDPECLPSTRTALLDDIYAWTDGHDEQCVYWLSGLAGTGKSTIARTVARRHYERRSLGASFFFTRGGGDLGHARKFVTSIAVQLAYNVPVSRQHICDGIAERPDISNSTLRDQWQQLVIRPLSALNTLGNITALVLVIDALDECDDDDDIRIVIELLAEAQALSGPKVRVFLTSRPEVAIRHGFYDVPDTSHQCFVLHHIASSVVDADIELFLKHNLAITGREQRLPAGWPGSEIVAKMVQRSNGLFIWAATAHRFVQQGRRFAARRLESVIESDTITQAEPEKHLDLIYMTILRSSLRPEYSEAEGEEHCKKLRYVLGTLVVLKEPLAAEALEKLLGVVEEGIESIIEDLHAILDVPGDRSRPIRLHHPSLRDFLLNESRCTDARFWIDEAQIHTALASRCIALMTSYFKQNGRVDDQMINRRIDNFFLAMMNGLGDAQMSLEEGNKVLKEKHKVLKERHKVLKERHKVLKGRHKVLKEEHKVLEEKHEVLKEKHEVLKEKHEVLKEKHEVLKEEKMVLEADFVKLKEAYHAEDLSGYPRDKYMNPKPPERDLGAGKSYTRIIHERVHSVRHAYGEFFKQLEAFAKRRVDVSGGRADLLKGGADFTIEDEDFLEGLEESLLKHHPHGLDRLIELESRVSHDDEALYSVELRYAVSNWARHFKKSGARSVDYGEAHVFLEKYLLDWQLTLIHYGNFSEEAGNTKYLIDCVPEDNAPLFNAFLRENITERSKARWESMGTLLYLWHNGGFCKEMWELMRAKSLSDCKF
ncbi:hypothetical protein AA0113_g6770 [Alternaria arborescens]|uniref:Nephrocystin 3-like N-terminal domain-containing protein n=1 Tax=Alternaria arborescens TaxID=156630 RepID=A0A4Q4RW27_9PLEO|nr:hypothetical protein AA0113_g6770 [Alternaria arborescens]